MFGIDHAKSIPTATNVDHFGVPVPDLQQAVTFFAEMLGRALPILFRRRGRYKESCQPEEGIRCANGSKLKVAMLRLGPTVFMLHETWLDGGDSSRCR